MTHYDSNFGHWENMDEEGMEDFYNQVQDESIFKQCGTCGQIVKLRVSYGTCNSCATQMERGGDPCYDFEYIKVCPETGKNLGPLEEEE
jgi:hypothetical protein|tara:strand:- start:1180 stop:1446 length:267 start_codon:yes stop_codon:yes gene_type:complete